MITREQLNKTFIRNEGELVDKWLSILGKTYSQHEIAFYLVYENGCLGFMTERTMQGGCGAQWLINNGYREVTLEDFKEEGEEEMETKDIDWSQAPEGYDYWIEYVGNLSDKPDPDFHKLTTRVSGSEVYSDSAGEFYLVNDRNIVVYKRPESVIEDKKIIQKYTREEFNTRGQALDSYDSGVVFYTPSNDGYSVVDESGILDHFGQLFTLEEREETWQDVAQEFIKNDPVLSGDKFVEDMFGDDFTEYHEPMRQLAKIIVEKSGDWS